MNQLEPPPSLVELVKDDIQADAIWKKWINNAYEWWMNNMSNEFYYEVGAGRVNGKVNVHKFGAISYRTPFNVFKPIASSSTYQTPTSAQALEIISSSANDTSGGSGAITVRVFGIKTPSSTEEETEDVALNGTSSVALASSWWRVYRLQVIESGTYAATGSPSHNSTITLRASGAGVTWAQIVPEVSFGLGQSEIGAYSVPTGKVAFLMAYHLEVSDTNKAGTIVLFTRENADDISAPYSAMNVKKVHRNITAGTILVVSGKTPLLEIVGPVDIGFMTQGSANMEVQVDFELIVEDR